MQYHIYFGYIFLRVTLDTHTRNGTLETTSWRYYVILYVLYKLVVYQQLWVGNFAVNFEGDKYKNHKKERNILTSEVGDEGRHLIYMLSTVHLLDVHRPESNFHPNAVLTEIAW
jgi:hypothetical protein